MLLKILGIIFVFIGLIYSGIALFYVLKCKSKTTGTLISIEEHRDYEKGNSNAKCYSPVYSYSVDDKDYIFSPKRFVQNPGKYELGSTTDIYYCASNPNVCLIKNHGDKLGISLAFVIVGTILLFVGA